MTPVHLSPLANHLWQSTLFAALAGLLTLAFRKHRAGVRYGLWLAASLKFLLPFSLLVALGSQFEWRTAAAPDYHRMPVAIEQMGQLLLPPAPPAIGVAAAARPDRLSSLLLIMWLAGFLWNLVGWFRRWRSLQSTLRTAAPLHLDLPIPAFSTAAHMEPGVFGIFRPVLLLPEGIARHMEPAQLEAIVAHELCHVRRHDNLAAALHMAVESLFWFHPLVWWLERRLVEERERACDEAVLGTIGDPEAYAEGILNVCKLCLSTPLVCVSGVVSGATGASLKQRIEDIMLQRETRTLKSAGKLLLAAAGLSAFAIPVYLGALNAPPLRAQEPAGTHLSFEVASVKVNTSGARQMGSRILPGGRYLAENVPLRWVMSDAFGIPFQGPRLIGLPAWVNSERYDFEAKADNGVLSSDLSSSARRAKIMAMLQTLLEERFQLKIRRESKEVPVYALVVAKTGAKLTPAKVDEKECLEILPGANKGVPCHEFNGGQGRGLHGQAITMTDMVQFVENWTDRPLVDRTNLKGLYAVETEGWVPFAPRPDGTISGEGLDDPSRPTLFMVMAKLGLKLEAQKAAVDFWTVDRLERPTGN